MLPGLSNADFCLAPLTRSNQGIGHSEWGEELDQKVLKEPVCHFAVVARDHAGRVVAILSGHIDGEPSLYAGGQYTVTRYQKQGLMTWLYSEIAQRYQLPMLYGYLPTGVGGKFLSGSRIFKGGLRGVSDICWTDIDLDEVGKFLNQNQKRLWREFRLEVATSDEGRRALMQEYHASEALTPPSLTSGTAVLEAA